MQRTSKYFLCILSLVIAVGLWLKATVIQVPSGSWAPAGSMAVPRSGAASVLLQDGTILVTGGEDASVTLASAEFFSAGSFAAAPAMNVARKGHTAVVLQDGRVLVAGGKTTGDGVTNAAEVYSPALNSWIVIASMADARSGHHGGLVERRARPIGWRRRICRSSLDTGSVRSDRRDIHVCGDDVVCAQEPCRRPTG